MTFAIVFCCACSDGHAIIVIVSLPRALGMSTRRRARSALIVSGKCALPRKARVGEVASGTCFTTCTCGCSLRFFSPCARSRSGSTSDGCQLSLVLALLLVVYYRYTQHFRECTCCSRFRQFVVALFTNTAAL